MPTASPTNGLSGHLQSSESWGRQQALELLRQTLTQNLEKLTLAQQRDYVRLQREAVGAERLPDLHSLLLQENQITSVPEVLFTDPGMRRANRGTVLHDNPLNAASLNRLTEYRARVGVSLGGALPGALHTAASPHDFDKWLVGVPPADHAQRRSVWEQLLNHEPARPADVFQVLRDLPQAYDYINHTQAFVARVWRLLHAMAESHELREEIFLNTYLAGTCGDGAILVFIDMELRHKQYQAMAQPSTQQANRELLALAHGLFYLRRLDQLAEDHLRRLRFAGGSPDDAEVKLYLRLHFADDFNLPILKENRLYTQPDPSAASGNRHRGAYDPARQSHPRRNHDPGHGLLPQRVERGHDRRNNGPRTRYRQCSHRRLAPKRAGGLSTQARGILVIDPPAHRRPQRP